MHLVKTIRPPGQFKRSVTNESNDCCVPKVEVTNNNLYEATGSMSQNQTFYPYMYSAHQ